jgi:NAD(P)-dependent dehydrogenase (short-subunit alcohol dehydrogenase family)
MLVTERGLWMRQSVGTAEQCADLVAFLASDRASHITGTIITIDGGAAHFAGVL